MNRPSGEKATDLTLPAALRTRVEQPRQLKLLQVAQARDCLRLRFRLAERWQQHPHQDRDDRNHKE
jgi:hypothetical protein